MSIKAHNRIFVLVFMWMLVINKIIIGSCYGIYFCCYLWIFIMYETGYKVTFVSVYKVIFGAIFVPVYKVMVESLEVLITDLNKTTFIGVFKYVSIEFIVEMSTYLIFVNRLFMCIFFLFPAQTYTYIVFKHIICKLTQQYKSLNKNKNPTKQ